MPQRRTRFTQPVSACWISAGAEWRQLADGNRGQALQGSPQQCRYQSPLGLPTLASVALARLSSTYICTRHKAERQCPPSVPCVACASKRHENKERKNPGKYCFQRTCSVYSVPRNATAASPKLGACCNRLLIVHMYVHTAGIISRGMPCAFTHERYGGTRAARSG